MIKLATDWVVANRSWIATGIVGKVEQLAIAVRGIDIDRVLTVMQDWGTTIAAVVEPLGGMKTAIGAVALMLGSPLLIAASSAITIMGALGKAMVAVGVLMWANPILAAVGAVSAAGFLLYRNWDWVRRQFERLWEWFRGSARLQRLIDDLKVFQGVPQLLDRAWQWARGRFQALWTWFKASAASWVKPVMDGLKPFYDAAADLMRYWEPVKAFFDTLWNGIIRAFEWAWEKIRPIVEAIREAAELFGMLSGTPVPGKSSPSTPNMEGGPLQQRPPGRRGVLPRLYDPSGAAPSPAPAQRGQVDVNVTLSNAPPGTRVATQASGGTLGNVTTDVGYSNPMGGGY